MKFIVLPLVALGLLVSLPTIVSAQFGSSSGQDAERMRREMEDQRRETERQMEKRQREAERQQSQDARRMKREMENQRVKQFLDAAR